MVIIIIIIIIMGILERTANGMAALLDFGLFGYTCTTRYPLFFKGHFIYKEASWKCGMHLSQ